ncbi:hypothetical protein L6Q96_15250 [Candidatus Binatia bacterium]|nr:hypothetical protein [Candidatus Binatia bacterium]
MLFLPILLAAYLCLYAPGHYLLRRTAHGVDDGSRLFREVLLSACCSSWLGFVLAEFGVFSLPALLLGMAAVAGAGAAVGRGRRPPAYDRRDLQGLAVLGLSSVLLLPPLDTRVLGSDSAAYLAAGVYLSRHGSLIIDDAVVPLMGPMAKYALFPSVTGIYGEPPYARLVGSFILSTFDGGEVIPAFHHLLIVWVAVSHALVGTAAMHWIVVLFGGLSGWAMFEFAGRSRGRVTAILFVGLLALSAPQNWYGRFLMPEVPGQFFLWGGLACLARWGATQRRADAVLAGLAFGMAGLMRFDNVAFLGVALPIGLWLGERRSRVDRLWILACAGVLWVHAAAHLLWFRTHYWAIFVSFGQRLLRAGEQASWGTTVALGGAVAVGGLYVLCRRRFAAWRGVWPLVVFAAGLALWGQWQRGGADLAFLAGYVGVPTLAVGALGLALWTVEMRPRDAVARVFTVLMAVAVAQFMLAPQATPVPIWLVRRAVPVVVPAFCFGVAFLCRYAAGRWHWTVAGLLFVAALAGQMPPLAQLRGAPHYRGGAATIDAVAKLVPPGACLLVDRDLAAWGFAPALWVERDAPAFLLSRFKGSLIAGVAHFCRDRPTYWIGDTRSPAPVVPGFVLTPVGRHAHWVVTPTLDTKTGPGHSVRWDQTVVVYAVKPWARQPGR